MPTTLTHRQQAVFDFVTEFQSAHGAPPSLREIASHFGFRSMNAAADHVRALRRKGYLEHRPRQARSLHRPHSSLEISQPPTSSVVIVHVPIYGSIPAGLPDDRQQASEGCLSVDLTTLGIQPTTRTFALEVRGDSMIDRHILDGDYVVLEHGVTPKTGDVVAALIDNESTLKTFVMHRNRPYLKAENPQYPDLIPAQELVIQGVMIALIRKRR